MLELDGKASSTKDFTNLIEAIGGDGDAALCCYSESNYP